MKPTRAMLRSLSATIVLAMWAVSVQGQFTSEVINGALTITGYAGPGGAVVIPGAVNGVPVVSIGEDAFAHARLTSVTIPSSVITIGSWAFEFCYGLTNATIGDGVVSVGEAAFWSCSNLTSVVIPSGVTSIGNGAFAFCSKLTNITIPNSVTDIAESAFSACTRLTSAVIPSSVTSIEDQTFQDCTGLTNV
ncbi:MAG TPA: leucine-rich repeat domain-containing protein, partial [Dongiaceae bacterium]|nr:leucine-rich repeat domain-containing protein [Dongiaceae bacterium]